MWASASGWKASTSRITSTFYRNFTETCPGGIHDGKLVWKESVEQGIENAPTAFLKLFTGENFGKMLVKLS